MNRSFGLALFVITTSVTGCDDRIDGYLAASSISANGFARDAKEIRKAQGQVIALWGFVDHRNLYGGAGAKAILQDWWSGDGPDAATWRFDLKVRENDEAGHSFAVHVPDDDGRDELLRAFLADARAQRPTRVFVKGRLFTFDAPTNVATHSGLYMQLQSSQNILLRPPKAR